MKINISQTLLAVFFIAAGVLHFVFPANYVKVMPPWLPAHWELVYLSGVCEIAGGAGVLIPALRRWAGWGLILLCLAVLPANVQMLLNFHADHSPLLWQVLLVLRLPLQLLLMWWIWLATQKRNEFIA